MINNALKKTPMPMQSPAQRCDNFEEVAQGYTPEQAMEEAARCLNCKHKPCCGGCPVGIDIPSFIAAIREGHFDTAYDVLSASSALPAVCGRVCPQEKQCEAVCVRGKKGEPVAIGRLERFAADAHAAREDTKPVPVLKNGIKAAVIGAGPAGLTCAGELARRGYAVTVFEALHRAGGVLVYGIPDFRLPGSIVERELENLRKMGVSIETNTVVGRTLSIDELFAQGYKAVFIGSGAGLPQFLHIPGENLAGVYSANEYLTRINLMNAYREDSETPIQRAKTVAVVGGGNVAMDAARCAKRLGAQTVYVLYRRSREEMPARAEEVEHAEEEGILFRFLKSPVAILGDEHRRVQSIQCVDMMLGEPDASGRRRPVEKPDSISTLPVDSVIVAVGTSPNPLLRTTTEGLETDRRGCLIADENGQTTRAGVFAGGDAVTGAATVILAMGAGKKAAQAMDAYMQSLPSAQPDDARE